MTANTRTGSDLEWAGQVRRWLDGFARTDPQAVTASANGELHLDVAAVFPEARRRFGTDVLRAATLPAGRDRWCAAILAARVHGYGLPPFDDAHRALLGQPSGAARELLRSFRPALKARVDAGRKRPGVVVGGGRPRGGENVHGAGCVTCVIAQSVARDRRRLLRPGARGALVAHAWHDETRPPSAWFADPGLDRTGPLTVTADGRVYGLLAAAGASRGDDLSRLLTGEIVCDDGSRVAATPVAETFDNTSDIVAHVTAGWRPAGIWVAGALAPDANPAAVGALRANGRVSLDLRDIGGATRVVGLMTGNSLAALTAALSPHRRVLAPTGVARVAVHNGRGAMGNCPCLDCRASRAAWYAGLNKRVVRVT